MKKHHGLLIGCAVLALAALFTLAGCDDKAEASGGDPDLVAKWYSTQTAANNQTAGYLVFEFTAGGSFVSDGEPATYSVSGNTITFTVEGESVGTVTYAIAGTKLTLSNGTGEMSAMTGDLYKKQ